VRGDVKERLQLVLLKGGKVGRLNPKMRGVLERRRWGRLRWGLRATTRVLGRSCFWVLEDDVEAEGEKERLGQGV
jgi:hypothetical protein